MSASIKMLQILTILLLVQNSQSLSRRSTLYQEIFAYHNDTALKADFASQVVDTIYHNYCGKQWFFTIIFCEFTYFENRILKYLQNDEDGIPVVLVNSCPYRYGYRVKPKIDRQGKTTYIVTSDELSLDLNERVIETLMRTGVFKPRNSLIFIINTPVDVNSYFYSDMVEHFELLWSRRIGNSILIVMADKLRVYAYNPFLSVVNDVTDVENLGAYLSRQYNNLYGYTLRVSVFRKIYISDDNGPITCNARMTTTMMKTLNATCLPLRPRDGSTVGDLLDNGTATGVTKDLLDGYTDLEFNSRILMNSYYGYIDTTYPLYQDDLCFMIKKADRQSSFTTTIKLLSVRMLTLFIFMVFLMITIGFVTRLYEANILGIRQRRFSSVMIDLMKCFLRQTFDVTFVGPAFRTVTLVIMLYSLIINCVIDSIIISAITYPRYKSDINTVRELFESNLTIGVHNRHMELFKKSVPDELHPIIEKRVQFFNDKKIAKVISERQYQYAILLRKSEAQAISKKPANMKNGRALFHVVQECPVPSSIVNGLRYGSPYLPRVNSILIRLYQAGILDIWSRDEGISMGSNVPKILDDQGDKQHSPLTWYNLEEVYYVLLLGLFISSIALAYEIVWHSWIHRLRLI